MTEENDKVTDLLELKKNDSLQLKRHHNSDHKAVRE